MYIVHVSPRHKADLSIELFEKDPEQQQHLIHRDISNGRMEMNLCKRDGTGLAHLENCLNKGGGNEAATNKHRFGGVTYIAKRMPSKGFMMPSKPSQAPRAERPSRAISTPPPATNQDRVAQLARGMGKPTESTRGICGRLHDAM